MKHYRVFATTRQPQWDGYAWTETNTLEEAIALAMAVKLKGEYIGIVDYVTGKLVHLTTST